MSDGQGATTDAEIWALATDADAKAADAGAAVMALCIALEKRQAAGGSAPVRLTVAMAAASAVARQVTRAAFPTATPTGDVPSMRTLLKPFLKVAERLS